MGTILGVVPIADATPALLEKLAPLGVVAVSSAPATSRIFVEVDAWTPQPAEDLAQRVSKALGIGTIAVVGQTTSDVYLVAEFARGEFVRRVAFNRDEGGWGEAEGSPRPWETDLHFAAPLDEFLERMTEDGASEGDLARARDAYGARDLARLPGLPDPSGSSLLAFLKILGADLSAGAHARYKKPGLFARVLGGR
jgi:hypothetical protein